MNTWSRTACWLLVPALAAGCASAAAPPGAPTAAGPPGESGRPRVEVTTDPAPTPPAAILPTPPPLPAPSAPATSSPALGPDTAAAPAPPEAGVPPPAPPSGGTEIPPLPAARPAARQLVLNFDNADVEIVIQAAAEIVGFNYVLAPTARGRKITVQTVGKISSDEVFAVLLTILDVNGLAAVRSGSLYRIIPREGAPQTPVKTVVGRDVSDGLPLDEVVTQIVPLQFINAQDAVALLRPFVPAQGALAAHRETNLLILTDTAANVRRLLEVLKLVDVEVALSELQIIALKHADAQELAQLLAQLFASGRVGSAPGAPGPPPLPLLPVPPVGTAPPPAAAAPGTPAADRPLIVPERRSNSLVVHARKQDMETIRRLIEKLDVDLYGGQRVFIYFAENTKARDLATTLDAIYGRRPRHHRDPAGPARGREYLRSHRVLPGPDAVVHGAAAALALFIGAPADRGAPGGRADPIPRRLRRGGPARGRDPLRGRRGHQRDHRHHLPAALAGDRGDDPQARQDAAPGPDRGAGRRGHADR